MTETIKESKSCIKTEEDRKEIIALCITAMRRGFNISSSPARTWGWGKIPAEVELIVPQVPTRLRRVTLSPDVYVTYQEDVYIMNRMQRSPFYSRNAFNILEQYLDLIGFEREDTNPDDLYAQLIDLKANPTEPLHNNEKEE